MHTCQEYIQRMRFLHTYLSLTFFFFFALFQSAVIGDEKAEMFRNKVTGRVQLLGVVQMVLIIAGSVLFLAFMGSYFICRSKKLK